MATHLYDRWAFAMTATGLNLASFASAVITPVSGARLLNTTYIAADSLAEEDEEDFIASLQPLYNTSRENAINDLTDFIQQNKYGKGEVVVLMDIASSRYDSIKGEEWHDPDTGEIKKYLKLSPEIVVVMRRAGR